MSALLDRATSNSSVDHRRSRLKNLYGKKEKSSQEETQGCKEAQETRQEA